MQHTVVVSDIHLCEVEPESGTWMRYRQRRFAVDDDLAAMLAALRREVRSGPGSLTLVLGGDVFDFDAPRVVGGTSIAHDLPRTAEHCVPILRAILDDHPTFVRAVAEVLADGHTVVVVSGNHDVALTLPEVRAVLAERLAGEAAAIARARRGPGAEPAAAPSATFARRIVFRAWLHRTDDGILVEHGHLYDPYCSHRYPMAPYGRRPGEIQPTMGSLAARLLISRLGYINPHVESTFAFTPLGGIAHWLRYYCLSRRSLVAACAAGVVRIFVELARRRTPFDRSRRAADVAACARETGLDPRALAKHARLFARPAEDRLGLVARQLWLDRVALVAFGVALTALCLAFAPGALAGALLLSPMLVVVYERTTPPANLDLAWRRVARTARRIAAIHGARVVVLGHTHRPDGAWEGGTFLGNSGSWSAAIGDPESREPKLVSHPLVWLTSATLDELAGGGRARGARERRIWGGLVRWTAGRFEPCVAQGAYLPAPAARPKRATGKAAPEGRPRAFFARARRPSAARTAQ